MKATELRIGNYVYEKYWCNTNRKYILEFIKLQSVSKSHVVCEKDDAFTFSDIEPIPLTEEILLKCGAEKINHIDGSKFHLIKNKKTNIKIRFYKTLVSVNSSFSIYDLKYLHQLQNLYFALTGEELNVKL